MISNISTTTPVARKEHRCMFCDGIIHKGEKYHLEKNILDGVIYPWKCHLHCFELTSEMDFFENDEGGINDENFRDWIDSYEYEHHRDEELDDIEPAWQKLSYEEKARLIYEELRSQSKIK